MGLLEDGLAGKVAVVVGGGEGVGRAITMALAGTGVDLAICDIDDDAAAATRKDVEALGRRILSMHADVCDVDEFDTFYDAVESQFDRLDIVVNVAGGVKSRPLTETTREQNAREIRLNYGYVIDSARRAIPLIRQGGRGGSIISFTTIEAHRGAATFSVYAGAKAATTNFSRAMAVELGSEQIRFNTIVPDTTPSRTSNSAMPAEFMARFDDIPAEVRSQGFNMYIPQQKAPSQEDLANAVLFLASDFSRAITGANLHVDGGTMAAAGFLNWPFGDGFMPAPPANTLKAMFGVD